jgi:hypothetical protein
MRRFEASRDTIPCPPPESGEYPVLQIEVSRRAQQLAPKYVDSVMTELRHALAALRCPTHGVAPAVHVDFGQEDDPIVAVVPHDCCSSLDALVARALDGSPIFRLMLPK